MQQVASKGLQRQGVQVKLAQEEEGHHNRMDLEWQQQVQVVHLLQRDQTVLEQEVQEQALELRVQQLEPGRAQEVQERAYQKLQEQGAQELELRKD